MLFIVASVPVFAFCGLFFYFSVSCTKYGLRLSFIFSSVVWGSWVVFLTELLSAFHLLSFYPVLLGWCLLCISIGLLLRKNVSSKAFLKEIQEKIERIAAKEWIILGGVFFILFITGFINVISPPTNVDSFTYHLARIPYWLQNQSVQHYPTPIARQLYQPPFAEFVLMHFHLLAGGDFFANFVQWSMGIGTLLNVSLLTKLLGGGRRIQILSLAMTACLPMFIAQSSSTQNDLIMSYWFTCSIILFFRFREKYEFFYALFLGISMGLMILTKGVGYLYSFPFCVYLLVICIYYFNIHLLKGGLIIGFLVLLLNVCHYSRNWQIFQHPIGPKKESNAYANGTHHPLNMLSNVVRNCALHLGTYTEGGNEFIHRYLKTFHYLIGVDESDSRTTSYQRFTMISNLSEDGTGNPLHFLLLCFTLLAFLLSLQHLAGEKRTKLSLYLLLLLSGFLIFCTYLKWQPFHSRLHLALFCAFIPFITVFFSYKNWLNALQITTILLLLASIPWLFFLRQRPLINDNGKSILKMSRQEILLQVMESDKTAKAASEAVEWLKTHLNIQKIGIVIDEETFDYGFYALLDNNDQRYIIKHILVSREGMFEKEGFMPDVILVLPSRMTTANQINWNGRIYRRANSSNEVGIFE
jgi:4-amino-4-deoxy-L-arabinose transferase-like glycosyltransferase